MFLFLYHKNPSLQLDEPIISLKEARKIMGKSASRFSDQQLLKLITDFEVIIGMFFGMVPNTSGDRYNLSSNKEAKKFQ